MSPSTASARVPETRSIDPRIKQTLTRIESLGRLEPDWDSYGGLPATSVARTAAIEWVEIAADLFGSRVDAAAVPYSVAPLAHGGVQLEWRGARGIVELEVGPSGDLGYLVKIDRRGDVATAEADVASWADVLRAMLSVFAA